jgi:hypothetical protein
MTCLIKPATGDSKGVLTLTTQERDRLVHPFADVRELLVRVKKRYAIGLHHNWHDYDLQYDDLFDFHMAGEEDLRERDGRRVPLVPMDACNFSPNCFHPGLGEKFWDVLFVARAVEFKGIPEFFQAIRRLYDGGHALRVLFICPVPPEAGPGSMRNVRAHYERLFTSQEQERFTLLTMDFRYPFPFDLPTISHFYRSSRTFVHSAPEERRCRVAAYAWATGIPVVGMAPVGSVLSTGLRKEPYFFEISHYKQFPERILAALASVGEAPPFDPVQAEIASQHSVLLLENHLSKLFKDKGWIGPRQGGWLQDLDIRLGRHHGLPAGVNRLDQDIAGLLAFLANAPDELPAGLLAAADPETEIALTHPLAPRAFANPQKPSPGLRQLLRPVARKLRSWVTP